MRKDSRKVDELRPLKMSPNYLMHAAGSVMVDWGNTRVLCAASVEEKVPPFRLDSGGGWVTGEYNMLPASTNTRKARRRGGRETEIQRLIGRSLRAAVDMDLMGPRTITVDCDVIQADGGTRVASITGGYVALALALRKLQQSGLLEQDPLVEPVAAVSVGIVDGELMLDLPYEEDVRAEVDLNLVMTAGGRYVEVQGTAEHKAFSRSQLLELCDLGWAGVQKLCELQARTVEQGLASSARE